MQEEKTPITLFNSCTPTNNLAEMILGFNYLFKDETLDKKE